jgi:glutaredoxin
MHVKIYTKENCPYCVKAKQFFKSKKIEFTEIYVGRDIARDEYFTLTGMKTVPAIYLENSLVGGYAELVEYAVDHPEYF